MKNQPGTMKNHGNQPKTMKNNETTGISKNVSNAGSQLTWEGGGAGISKNGTRGGVTTDLGGG